MVQNKNLFYVRAGIIIFSILLILFSLISIFQVVSGVLNSFLTLNSLEINSLVKSDFLFGLVLMTLGLVLFKIGRHWSNVLKEFTKTLVSIAIFCFSIFIILFSINSYSEEISNSIQPSIDLLVTDALQSYVYESIEENSDKSLSLVVSNNSKILTLYSKNLSKNDSLIFEQMLGLESFNEEDKIYISSLIISWMYDEIKSNNPELLNTAIPVSTLESELAKAEFDKNILDSIEISTMKSIFTVNQDAYIKLLLSENASSKIYTVNNINKTDVNEIWNSLNLTSNISEKSKVDLTKFFLSLTYNELSSLNMETEDIFLESTYSLLPVEMKEFVKYDFLSNNSQTQIEAVKDFRNYCETGLINTSNNESLVCQSFALSKYESFVKNLDNLSSEAEFEMPIEFDSFLSNYDTIDKIEFAIYKKTNSWNLFLLFTILFFLLANLTYFLHFKLFKRELILEHIPYFISKLNLFVFISSFIIFLVVYLLFKSGKLLSLLSFLIPAENHAILNLVVELPIYKSLIDVITLVFLISVVYLLMSLLLFAMLYFILKRRVDSLEY